MKDLENYSNIGKGVYDFKKRLIIAKVLIFALIIGLTIYKVIISI